MPIPVAVLSKAQVCGHFIVDSNPANCMDVLLLCLLFAVCCVGSGLCDVLLLARSGECVCVCVCVCVCLIVSELETSK